MTSQTLLILVPPLVAQVLEITLFVIISFIQGSHDKGDCYIFMQPQHRP